VKYSSNLSAIYAKWGAQTFTPIFGLFAIFDRNFAKIVAPPSNGKKNIIVYSASERAIASEKSLKKVSKSTHKQRHNGCSKYILKRTARRTRSVTDRTRNQKHHLEGNAIPAGLL